MNGSPPRAGEQTAGTTRETGDRRTDDELQTTEDPELRCCQKLSCCSKNETSRNLFGSLQTQSRHLGRSSALLLTSCHDSNKCVETTLSSAVAPCKHIS